MAEEDIHKTAGLFEFFRMSFSLHVSAQSFQRLIDEVLHGLLLSVKTLLAYLRKSIFFHIHQPQTTHCNLDKYSPSKIHHLDYVSQFISDIRYITGNGNIVANTISGSTITTVDSNVLSYGGITEEQKKVSTLLNIQNDTLLQLRE